MGWFKKTMLWKIQRSWFLYFILPTSEMHTLSLTFPSLSILFTMRDKKGHCTLSKPANYSWSMLSLKVSTCKTTMRQIIRKKLKKTQTVSYAPMLYNCLRTSQYLLSSKLVYIDSSKNQGLKTFAPAIRLCCCCLFVCLWFYI